MSVDPRRTFALLAAAGLAAVVAAPAAVHAHPDEADLVGRGDPGEAARFAAFPSNRVTFLSRVTINQMDPDSGDANDCWGYVSPSGREIAIIGLESATSFVDITVPTQPVILATFTSPTSPWRDIKVLGDFAYGVSEGGGHIQIFDLRNVDNGVVINNGFTSFGGGPSSSHNIVVNEDSGYLYRVGGGNDRGLRAYSVGANGLPGSATSPVQSLSQSNLYVHDAQVVTYTEGPYAGREIAFLCSGFGNGGSDTALRIFDVTNKSSIVQLGTVRYPGRAYSHQGWLSEDRKYFYMNDELDEGATTSTTRLHIVNVEDLENPQYVDGWTNGNTARDHNLYVKGDYIYAANYRSGLRIHDISDPENPVEVAWIDTYPADDSSTSANSGFDGAWSSYPFFPSGNVIISDIQQGLVVVRPEVDTLELDVFQPLGQSVSPAGGVQVLVQITENDETELDPASPRLFLRSASTGEVQSITGTIQGGGVVSFDTPVLECLETIDWWIEAGSTDGRSFGAPALGGFETFTAVVADAIIPVFADNAESDPGWTVSGNASDGQWSRGTPVNADRADPPADADGSGRAWLTDNVAGNSDVDSGQTVLTSPTIDASAGGVLSYSYWLNDTIGGEIGAEDFFRVDISTNNGASWDAVQTVTTPLNTWRENTVEIGGSIPATDQLRVRYIASETTPGDILEAGVDAVAFTAFECEDPGCTNPADVNGDNVIDGGDFFAWVNAFSNNEPGCDQNGDGSCDGGDFFGWVANFSDGC
ncbi:MAG: choice-of-anchor B family protein [Planctomycetota bacterium]